MKFTSNQHESNFLDLMVMDNTYHDGSVDFCSSGRSLIRLGFNLYNNYKTDELSPCALFWSLDSHSMSLALNAMKLRFDSMEMVEFRQSETLPASAEEEQEDYEL